MKKDILQELEVLQAKKIISQAEYKRLQLYYAEEQKKEQGFSSTRFITIISSIGSVLIGAGILLLVGTNRDSIPDTIKTTFLITIMILVYIAGLYLSYYKDYPRLGYSLVLLGSIIYGANIFLLGQIYNIGGSYIDALGVWAIGVLPFAYVTGFTGLLLVGIVPLIIYIFSYMGEYTSLMGQEYSIFGGFLSLVFIALAGFHTYKKQEQTNAPYTNFGRVFLVTGTVGLCIALYALTYERYTPYTYNTIFSDTIFFLKTYLVWIVIGSAIIGENIKYLRNKKLLRDPAYNIILVVLCISGGWGYMYPDVSYVSHNIFFLLFIVYMIYTGIQKDTPAIVNLALIFFVLFVITKYVDLFYDMLSGGIFFIIGGICLLVGGFFLEKLRKRLLQLQIEK